MALMMSVKTIISTSVAIIATGAMFACVAPFASADSAQTSAVVSSRSFPKASSVKKNLFAESTSTSVDENSKWGGIETLDVPQTESQGEKEAAAAAAAQKAADEAAAAQSAAAAAASRSEQRASIPQVDLGKMTGTGTGAELASFSLKFQAIRMLPAATLRQDGIAPVLCSTSSPSLASPCLVPLVLKPPWVLRSQAWRMPSRVTFLRMVLMRPFTSVTDR